MLNHEVLIAILLLSPLVGFFINGLRFRSHNYVIAGTVATGAVAISFAASVMLFTQLLEASPENRRLSVTFFEWMSVSQFKVNAGFLVDQISGIMILIITTMSIIQIIIVEGLNFIKTKQLLIQ